MNALKKKIFHIGSNRVTARWIVVLVDLSMVLQTFFLAYLIRFNFTLNFKGFPFVKQLPLIALVALFSFYVTGSYKGVVRYTSVRDATRVIAASALLAFILSALVFFNLKYQWIAGLTIPRSIIAIHFLLNTVLLTASRFVYKYVYDMLISGNRSGAKALIYGAGESGIITLNALRNDRASALQVVGFIDDNAQKRGISVNGIPVIHSTKLSREYIEKNQIREIIISIQNIDNAAMMRIVDKVSQLPVKVKIVPPVEKWIGGTLQAVQITDINIEDLLNRHPIDIDNPVIARELYGKTVLITGAAGSIGSELARQVSHYGYKKLILVDMAESALYDLQQELESRHVIHTAFIIADIRDRKRMEEIFEHYRPGLIFHAAAYKHVPLMEENPYEAVSVNVFGTKNIMDLSAHYQADKFIMISTDKAVNPTNVMGATKRAAEMYATCLNKKGNTKFITTRFGNVLGSNGSVIPLFRKQIAQGGPLTVTHRDITRFFMTIPEACQLVLEAGAMGKGGEIFVFDMGESVKIFDLAKKMIQLSGYRYPDDIDIKITGLRPGEKLYEEVLADHEKTLPTHHKKIKIARVAPVNEQKLLDVFSALQDTGVDANLERVLLLKSLIPEYISQNSPYTDLDSHTNTGTG